MDEQTARDKHLSEYLGRQGLTRTDRVTKRGNPIAVAADGREFEIRPYGKGFRKHMMSTQKDPEPTESAEPSEPIELAEPSEPSEISEEDLDELLAEVDDLDIKEEPDEVEINKSLNARSVSQLFFNFLLIGASYIEDSYNRLTGLTKKIYSKEDEYLEVIDEIIEDEFAESTEKILESITPSKKLMIYLARDTVETVAEPTAPTVMEQTEPTEQPKEIHSEPIQTGFAVFN